MPRARIPAFIPPPTTNNVNLALPLDIVLPEANEKIARAKALVFHAVGDTGGVQGTETQEALAALMVKQIEESRANHSPAEEPLFFYHLGDVVYFNGMSADYPAQFYEPYQCYDAPSWPSRETTTATLHAQRRRSRRRNHSLGFMQNFCAPSPQFLSNTAKR